MKYKNITYNFLCLLFIFSSINAADQNSKKTKMSVKETALSEKNSLQHLKIEELNNKVIQDLYLNEEMINESMQLFNLSKRLWFNNLKVISINTSDEYLKSIPPSYTLLSLYPKINEMFLNKYKGFDLTIKCFAAEICGIIVQIKYNSINEFGTLSQKQYNKQEYKLLVGNLKNCLKDLNDNQKNFIKHLEANFDYNTNNWEAHLAASMGIQIEVLIEIRDSFSQEAYNELIRVFGIKKSSTCSIM